MFAKKSWILLKFLDFYNQNAEFDEFLRKKRIYNISEFSAIEIDDLRNFYIKIGEWFF